MRLQNRLRALERRLQPQRPVLFLVLEEDRNGGYVVVGTGEPEPEDKSGYFAVIRVGVDDGAFESDVARD